MPFRSRQGYISSTPWSDVAGFSLVYSVVLVCTPCLYPTCSTIPYSIVIQYSLLTSLVGSIWGYRYHITITETLLPYVSRHKSCFSTNRYHLVIADLQLYMVEIEYIESRAGKNLALSENKSKIGC